jgi:hypothetical protein
VEKTQLSQLCLFLCKFLVQLMHQLPTDTSPRVAEPCSFHHLQKKLGLVSSDLDAPRILVPESLNLANFTTYRNMTLEVPGITMEISPRVTEPWSFHHHTERGFMSRDLDGVQSTQIPVPESLNRAVFTTYRKS